jgi:hypothetical protein
MSAPSNGYLGREQLFEVGDIVFYHPTPYWRSDTGMWARLRGKKGRVDQVQKLLYFFVNNEVAHPFRYDILFEGRVTCLTPAPENLHHFAGENTWEI